jgi:RNA polymerase sigma-70 factor (ECF subfamily)
MGSNRPGSEVAAGAPDVTPAALYHCHARTVFAVCLANTRNYHDAEDVMQAVFLKATRKASSLRDPGRARAWLLQIARRECVELQRRQRPAEPLPVGSLPAPSDDHAVAQHLTLNRAILKLPAKYRETIILYYLDGRDCGSVAATLRTTEAAIRQRLVRGRAMLHTLLEEEKP